ncbi:hypothetical protein F4803DRAFT_507413 [Xylaria telfairii]|nr:hypothetical protein F4803DRAFT_507413 [Xylaria telfairii]
MWEIVLRGDPLFFGLLMTIHAPFFLFCPCYHHHLLFFVLVFVVLSAINASRGWVTGEVGVGRGRQGSVGVGSTAIGISTSRTDEHYVQKISGSSLRDRYCSITNVSVKQHVPGGRGGYG